MPGNQIAQEYHTGNAWAGGALTSQQLPLEATNRITSEAEQQRYYTGNEEQGGQKETLKT